MMREHVSSLPYLACFAGRRICVSSPSVHALLLLLGDVGFVSGLKPPVLVQGVGAERREECVPVRLSVPPHGPAVELLD